MKREVDLVSYLPPFIAEYRETKAALKAENPEFKLIWEATEKVLKNEFIETADEYGITRYEKMLGILPSWADTLEGRRARVQSRWFTILPYTWKMLLKMIERVLEGTYNFLVWWDFRISYELVLTVHTLDDSRDMELRRILDQVTPANLLVSIIYENPLEGNLFLGGMMYEVDILEMKESAR